ncbi:MarR family transcriptional regulator [Halorubrum sp. AD140]|uniref:MarR family transcriptional regulator n=1 Tax=Halorubrum sp. AD140 TaxID=3050073 RepID=UPI002ACC61FD|nr:MarR family transcriptional regulator [Halorubrum sp. AD140]MDZ5810565.1 MarR family transcriptional regulator [Halorubrum sp. AD140]
MQHYFLNAIGTVTGRSYNELETLLNTVGITETPLNGHGTRSLLHEHRRRHTQTTAWKLLTVLRELGTGHSTTDDIHAAAQLFRFATTTHDDTQTTAPTIAVEITPGEFEALDRQQRTNICELIGILSKAFDIKLVTTRVTEAFIRHHHRDHLPGVSEWANAHHPESRIDDALTDLNADDTETQILRALDDTPGHTLSYHETHATLETSRSRVRQCISTLKDYGLIETYNPDSAKKITLLNAGEEVLTYFNQHDGRQTTLQNSVSGTPNSSRQRRVPRQRPGDHPAGDRTGTDDRTTDSPGSTTAPYRTVYLNRADHAAIAACGSDSSGVTVVDTGVSDVDSRSRFVSMDDRRGEAVVSVHATNPLDYTVSIAVALASPRLVDAALGERTLDRVLDEVPSEVLRRVRQIGYLTDDVLADGESFRDMLVQWGEDIEMMTKKLHHGEYDERTEFVGEIVSESHGLAGSIVHLLDAAGVDLIRDVRVPAGVNSGKLADLGKSIAHSVLVQSRYQSHAAFRQLFEEREEKRASAFSVEVDAADPHGSFIGSMVVRGGSASRLQEVLESELEGVSPHEDAPEFVVPVNVTSGVSREMVAVTVARVLGPKNLRAPRRIVSVLDAVVESPFAVAAALQQLGAESSVREMDGAELRFVLRQVPSRDVLPGLPRSAGEIVSALVHADRVLSQTELCDRAGVSAQTVRNHASVLEATGLVSRDGAGWRVQLSFRVERGEMVLPVTDVACEDVEGGVRRVVAAIPGSCEEDVGRGSSVSVVRAEVVVGGVVEQMSVLAGVDEPDDDIERSPGDGVGAGACDGVGGSGGGAEIDLDFSDVSIPGAVACD